MTPAQAAETFAAEAEVKAAIVVGGGYRRASSPMGIVVMLRADGRFSSERATVPAPVLLGPHAADPPETSGDEALP